MYQNNFVPNRGIVPENVNDSSAMQMCAGYPLSQSTPLSSQDFMHGHQLYSSGGTQFSRRPLQLVQVPHNDTITSHQRPSPANHNIPLSQGAWRSSQNYPGQLSQGYHGPSLGEVPERFHSQGLPVDCYGNPHQNVREAFFRDQEESFLYQQPVSTPVVPSRALPPYQHPYSAFQPELPVRTSLNMQMGEAGAYPRGLTADQPQHPVFARPPGPRQETPQPHSSAPVPAPAPTPKKPVGTTEQPPPPRPAASRLPNTPEQAQGAASARGFQLASPTRERPITKASLSVDNGLRVLTGTVDQILIWGRKVEEAVRPNVIFEIVGSLDCVRRGPLYSSVLISLRALEGNATVQGVHWEIDRPLLAPNPGSIVSCMCRLGPKASAVMAQKEQRPPRVQLPRLQVLKVRPVQGAQLKHLRRISYASSHAVQQGALQQPEDPEQPKQDTKKQALISSYLAPNKPQ